MEKREENRGADWIRILKNLPMDWRETQGSGCRSNRIFLKRIWNLGEGELVKPPLQYRILHHPKYPDVFLWHHSSPVVCECPGVDLFRGRLFVVLVLGADVHGHRRRGRVALRIPDRVDGLRGAGLAACPEPDRAVGDEELTQRRVGTHIEVRRQCDVQIRRGVVVAQHRK